MMKLLKFVFNILGHFFLGMGVTSLVISVFATVDLMQVVALLLGAHVCIYWANE